MGSMNPPQQRYDWSREGMERRRAESEAQEAAAWREWFARNPDRTGTVIDGEYREVAALSQPLPDKTALPLQSDE